MKIKPIIFNTEMVRAIIENRKTQTRRPMPVQPSDNEMLLWRISESTNKKFDNKLCWDYDCLDGRITAKNKVYFTRPYDIGDILYVRETFQVNNKAEWVYYADENEVTQRRVRWRPSIHMPKEAARFFLKVTNVRYERVQDITEKDAKSEGVIDPNFGINGITQHRSRFKELWQGMYGSESWDENHYVWVYEFERVDKPDNVLL